MFRAGLGNANKKNTFGFRFQKPAKMYGKANFLARKFLGHQFEDSEDLSKTVKTVVNSPKSVKTPHLESKRMSIVSSKQETNDIVSFRN